MERTALRPQRGRYADPADGLFVSTPHLYRKHGCAVINNQEWKQNAELREKSQEESINAKDFKSQEGVNPYLENQLKMWHAVARL